MSQLPEQSISDKQITLVVYILYALVPFLGYTVIPAIIINHLKKNSLKGTWLASHFKWQITTFNILFIVFVIACLFVMVSTEDSFGTQRYFPIFGVLLFAFGIWYIYRIIKGLLYLNGEKELPDSLI
ncbi:MAG: hypothetical protein WCL30_04585 [Pseudomonadota bacterium]